ncbi:MAG: right-handed parallel beta-helix repeat-containing protein [Gorillibacterium sp.]|nr:right-handed parallel beta-helix repeat-containing protein [Gorillibacterium sp.]
MDRCLIYSNEVEHIGFTGPGTIDGQGHLFGKNSTPRPIMMRFLNCRHIKLSGLKLRRPAAWSTAFILCDTVYADGLDIESRANDNGDGLDFDSCQNVFVANCKFDTSDDSICLQNSEKDHACRNITITNCIMTSKWAAVRIGLLSSGNFEDITISNCIFHDITCSGFKIQSTEGGQIRNMLFQNIVMRNVTRPIFLTLNHFHIGKDAPSDPVRTGGISNLSFDHIRATNDSSTDFDPASGIVIMGTPGFKIKDIQINNYSFTATGGGNKVQGSNRNVTELIDERPEFFVFNELPSYGIYARHVDGLSMHNLKLDFLEKDDRPAIVLDDVENAELSIIRSTVSNEAEAMIRLYETRDIHIHNCRSLNGKGNLCYI